MDEIVIRAKLKWPDVPSVYGWLSLDRRGRWMIKTVSGRFERIVNRSVCEFINRNYSCDSEGRWFFQNGPQRVFVSLEYTPLVYRLDDTGDSLVAHTGTAPHALRDVFVDDAGGLLLRTELGVGVVLDRDLHSLLDAMEEESGGPAAALVERLTRGNAARSAVRLLGKVLPIGQVRAGDVERVFGFVSRPLPRPGEAEC